MNAQRRGAAVIALLVPLVAVAAPWQDPPPDDERAEQVALGRLVFDNSCRMCHEPALVHQQRLSPAQWDAEIEKMIGWGATVAPEERGPLHAYLVENFGPANDASPHPIAATEVPKPPRRDLNPAQITGTGDPTRGADLYTRHCLNCHGADGRGGEPGQNLVEQEILPRADAFADVTRDGRHKMPGFAEVLDAPSIEDIRTWLLTLRYDQSPPA
jgi:mono/diheme cytochrome c family protein